jgi:hypothetical protein
MRTSHQFRVVRKNGASEVPMLLQLTSMKFRLKFSELQSEEFRMEIGIEDWN